MLPALKVTAEELGECKKKLKETATPPSEQGNQIWPNRAEVHMKGMNSMNPKAFIFPYTEC